MVAAYWYCTRATQYHVGAPGLSVAGRQLGFRDAFFWLIVFYAIALVPYYALLPAIRSKSRIALAFALGSLRDWRSAQFGVAEQQALLTILLKLFFIPVMVNWFIGNAAEVLGHGYQLMRVVGQPQAAFLDIFNQGLYMLLFKLLLMIDVVCFTVGYMVELPFLRNEIKSVDPTMSGWLVCIVCYPPFNQIFGLLFPWQSPDFPSFSEPAVHIGVNCALLAAMAIYAWASLALGWRASNLTNRGIVASGPYAWVRHPAYAFKNLAWWIGALPGLVVLFGQSFTAGLWGVTCLGVWSAVYVLRALTEERHLLMLGNGYTEYMQRVPYRFVSGVI